MTESEWRNSTDPTPMLTFLTDRVSERKVRLLACACCRRIWEHLPDERSREGVIVAERFADDQATPRELAKAHNNALVVKDGAAWAVYWATSTRAAGPVQNVFAAAAAAPARHAAKLSRKVETWEAVQADTMRQQADLIREVVGNPFRPVEAPDAHLLRWEGGLLRQLAEGIYQERAFERMPVLGDALEEAGCSDECILEHCRSKGLHVRGCWVVDWLLGKS